MINAAHNASHVAAKIGFLNSEPPFKSLPSGEVTIFRAKERILPLFLNRIVTSDVIRAEFRNIVKGIHIYPKDIQRIQIPLPPLDTQREIVSEIESYQRVIDGARAVVENWRPRIAVDPEWPVVELGEVCETIRNGYNVEQTDRVGKYKVTRIQTIADGTVDLSKTKWTNDDVPANRFMQDGDILFSHINSVPHLAKTAIFYGSQESVVHGINLLCLRPRASLIDPWFLLYSLKDDRFVEQARRFAQRAVNQASIKLRDLKNMRIVVPPKHVQVSVVHQIHAEKRLVDGNKKLIERMVGKINATIGKVWVD